MFAKHMGKTYMTMAQVTKKSKPKTTKTHIMIHDDIKCRNTPWPRDASPDLSILGWDRE